MPLNKETKPNQTISVKFYFSSSDFMVTFFLVSIWGVRKRGNIFCLPGNIKNKKTPRSNVLKKVYSKTKNKKKTKQNKLRTISLM